MNLTFLISILTLLFISEPKFDGRDMTEKNKTIVGNFIRDFWNNEGSVSTDYSITCVCGEKVRVTAKDTQEAVAMLIPSMDKHVASKEHPEVPKNLTLEQKDGMVRATMRNSTANKYLSASYVDHSLPAEMPQGIEGFQMMSVMFKSGFPDLHVTIEDQIAEGNKVVSRVTLRGTNKGSFMGAPPSNRKIEMRGIRIDRIEDGTIVEHWAVADQMGMMRQLGVLPAQPKK